MNSIVFSSSRLKNSSLSINIGFAPQYLIVLTGEINVKLGTITSSPDFTFDKINERCNAAVPELTATLYLIFK